jgi:hypothetical protein
MGKRLLICGDRDWTDFDVIWRTIQHQPRDTVIIQGEGRGADALAKRAALEAGLQVESYPADWRQYGAKAGPLRNRRMLAEGKPDTVVGFHCDIGGKSKGTRDMLRISLRAGIPTFLFGADRKFQKLSSETLEAMCHPLVSQPLEPEL